MSKKGRSGESIYSKRRLEAVEKQRRALELRMAGRQWAEIAKAVGYASHSGAIAAVEAALKKTLTPAVEEHRALTLERLTRILASYWPAMLQGDAQSAGICLGSIDRMRGLLGLDIKDPAPGSSKANPLWTQQVEAVDLSAASDADLDAIIDKARAIQEAGKLASQQRE